LLVPCTVLALTTLLAAPQSSSRDALAKPFAYDASRPVDEKVEQLYERDGITTFEVMFPSPRGGTVTGYLVVPSGKGPFAGLVFGHWGPGNSTEFLPEANLYAEAGTVSVMIDYPWVRRAPWRVDLSPGLGQPEKDRDGWIAAVVDLRRAIDLLAARGDVDRGRIGYTCSFVCAARRVAMSGSSLSASELEEEQYGRGVPCFVARTTPWAR
jgi:hypothetical protein